MTSGLLLEAGNLDMAIGVHVIGPGHGETIIIELPDRTFGVIDACRPGGGQGVHFPARDFLRSQGPPYETRPLRFLAVTHPHADHCIGINELREEFEPEKLWVFHSIFTTPMVFLKAWADGRLSEQTALDVHAHPGSIALEFMELRECARQLMKKRQPPDRFRTLETGYQIALCQDGVSIHFFSPLSSSRHRYNDQITRATEQLLSQLLGPESRPGAASSANHNFVSPVILVIHGKTRIILMADTELPIWNDIVAGMNGSMRAMLQNATLIKAAHHGSANGYHNTIYSLCCKRGAVDDQTIIVVTPFVRLKNPLPRKSGIDQIIQHSRRVYCTNRNLATFSAERGCIVDSSVVPALPELLESPSMKSYLTPEFGGPESFPNPDTPLPPALVQLCVEKPDTLFFVNPGLRGWMETLVRLPQHDMFRTSFWFDDQGSEIPSLRYVGPGAGMFA